MPSCEGNKIELTRLLRPPALPSFCAPDAGLHLHLAATGMAQFRRPDPSEPTLDKVRNGFLRQAGRAPFLPLLRSLMKALHDASCSVQVPSAT